MLTLVCEILKLCQKYMRDHQLSFKSIFSNLEDLHTKLQSSYKHLIRYSFLFDQITTYSNMFCIAKKNMLNFQNFLITEHSTFFIASGMNTIVTTLSLMSPDGSTIALHVICYILQWIYLFTRLYVECKRLGQRKIGRFLSYFCRCYLNVLWDIWKGHNRYLLESCTIKHNVTTYFDQRQINVHYIGHCDHDLSRIQIKLCHYCFYELNVTKTMVEHHQR